MHINKITKSIARIVRHQMRYLVFCAGIVILAIPGSTDVPSFATSSFAPIAVPDHRARVEADADAAFKHELMHMRQLQRPSILYAAKTVPAPTPSPATPMPTPVPTPSPATPMPTPAPTPPSNCWNTEATVSAFSSTPDQTDGDPYTTATGTRVRIGTIAVDPRIIPLWSRIFVPGYGWGTGEDTGGAVKGMHVDVWMPTRDAALQWGIPTLTIQICGPS